MIRFRAFGAPDLRGDETTELRAVLTQPRLLALLAFIAFARPRTFQRRDTLLAFFWPELNTEQARNALRQALHRLRRALGEGVLSGRGSEEVGLDPAHFWSDVVAFERALDDGRPEEALQVYRGDLLPGFHVSDAPEFERWLDGERDRLRQRAVTAAWLLADRELAAGRGAAAAHWARTAVEPTPHDEQAIQRLLRILNAVGDPAGAARAYETFAARLAEGLGVEPSPETRALVARPRSDPPGSPAVWDATPPAEPAPPPPTIAPEAGLGSAHRATDRRDSWRRRLAVPAVAVAVMLLGAIVIVARRGAQDAAPAARTLAVLPFTVRGSPELAYLRDAMVDLISAKLDGAAGFHAIDPRSVIGAASDSASGAARPSGARTARRLGASWYLQGDVVEIAGRLEISGALYDLSAGARAVSTASVSGETTALFALVDDLAGRLLAGLTAGRDTTLTRLAALTTQSLPALKAYLRGEQLLRAGRDGEAAAAFREAVALDSAFALAQYRLALALTGLNVASDDDPRDLVERAARHAERLSPLVRDLLEAYRAYRRWDADDAERRYRVLTDGHPHNVEAWLMLGETLFHFNGPRGRSPMEAWPAFERALALEPSNPHALMHLARLAARAGRGPALDSLAERYLAVHQDVARSVEIRALHAFARDDTAARPAIVNAVTEAGDLTALVTFQDAVLYAHNPVAAGELLPAIVRPSSTPFVEVARRRALGDLSLAAGRLGRGTVAVPLDARDRDWWIESEALLLSDPLYPVAPARIAALRDSVTARESHPTLAATAVPERDLGSEVRAYLLGLLHMRLGDSAGAAAQLAVLGAVVDPERAAVARALAHAVRAEMARAAGDLPLALSEVEQFPFAFSPHLAHWGVRERFLRAELLRALGRDAEALPWYDSFTGAYDTPWLAAAQLRSGEVYQRLGDRERATFHYGRFVRLWDGCDPELRPLVAQAGLALARLAAGRD